MVSNNDIEQSLERLNGQTARLFASTRTAIRPFLDDSQLEGWSQACFELADAGWHAWEVADAFLELSVYLAEVDAERLLQIAGYGQRLSGFSFEPGKSYFHGVSLGIRERRLDALPAIERYGREIVDLFPHATNLIARFFDTAFSLACSYHQEELADWLTLTARFAHRGRSDLLTFLGQSGADHHVNWPFLLELHQHAATNAMLYLEHYGRLTSRLTVSEPDFEQCILRFCREGHGLQAFLESLVNMAPRLTHDQFRLLVMLCARLPDPTLATALVHQAERVPLGQQEVMNEWLEEGLLIAPRNEAAAKAYFGLESARSEEVLEMLLGQVRVSDEQRVLQLYCEAMSGTRLKIESLEETPEGNAIPYSDGHSLFLPAVISRYSGRDENHRWLKVAVSHQLGCYEFGTFQFRFNNSYEAFGEYFQTFDDPALARQLFSICEGARVDWQLQHHYRGINLQLAAEKALALEHRDDRQRSPRQQLLEGMIRFSLDEVEVTTDPLLQSPMQVIADCLMRLKVAGATVNDSMTCLQACFESIYDVPRERLDLEPLPPVLYRGFVLFDEASINVQLALLEDLEAEFAEEQEGMNLKSMANSDDLNIDEIEAGDVENPMAMMIKDDSIDGADDIQQTDKPGGLGKYEEVKARRQAENEIAYRYDEWDFNINDYRRRWCTLFEIRHLEEDVEFVPRTLAEHRSLANRVRKQLNMLRPELLRKVKGVDDGEELDLERTVEAMVDLRSGISPDENIYIQRQRKERDVSALFLLDMSASTDDEIEKKPPEPIEDEDEYLRGIEDLGVVIPEKGKTIIDVEKESVVLMAEALQGLGDNYAVCGFSGYGRDRVEYYICKDFDEPYNYKAKGSIGGIKPCRSTRMGPAIRHATKMLADTESRIKALIIISDGYPQDFDYGQDRNSKDYGIKDTTKALTEATQKGVQSFCLTVDPSGHDYLREMCPDHQYMVMQDITQLPDELSKVYRGLTT